MGFLDSLFQSERGYTADIERLQQTVDPTTGALGAKGWFTVTTVKTLYWRGSMADSFISAQHRPIVSAVALVRPSDIAAADIPDNGRLTIRFCGETVAVYSIVKADDIGGQREVVVIQLTEYKAK